MPNSAEGPKPRRKKPPKLLFEDGEAVKAFRKSMHMNQTAFWAVIGLTQSAGSRYESGRTLPWQAKALLHMAYGTERNAEQMLCWLRDEAQRVR